MFVIREVDNVKTKGPTVIELDIIPVNETTYALMDTEIAASTPLIGSEPAYSRG